MQAKHILSFHAHILNLCTSNCTSLCKIKITAWRGRHEGQTDYTG